MALQERLREPQDALGLLFWASGVRLAVQITDQFSELRTHLAMQEVFDFRLRTSCLRFGVNEPGLDRLLLSAE